MAGRLRATHAVVDAVQVRGSETQEVDLIFSPRLEHICLQSKKCLLDYLAQKPSAIGLRSQYALRLYDRAKKVRLGRNQAHYIGATWHGTRAGSGKGCSRQRYPGS